MLKPGWVINMRFMQMGIEVGGDEAKNIKVYFSLTLAIWYNQH